MGLTFLDIEVGNPANPSKTAKVNFFVDSGAIYTVVPAALLLELGIQPLSKEEFTLANGEKIRRKKGIALFRYAGRVGGRRCRWFYKGLKAARTTLAQPARSGIILYDQLSSVSKRPILSPCPAPISISRRPEPDSRRRAWGSRRR